MTLITVKWAAVILLKQSGWKIKFGEKWNDARAICCQNRAKEATTNRSRKLWISGRNMGAGTDVFFHKLSGVVYQKRRKCHSATLEAMQRVISSFYNQNNGLLKLGCALPTSFVFCLHKYTKAKTFLIAERDQQLMQEYKWDMVGGPHNVLARKVVGD